MIKIEWPGIKYDKIGICLLIEALELYMCFVYFVYGCFISVNDFTQ